MRISCHLLPIESGRYKKIPRVERLCPLCNRSEIGDEFHYLLKCTHSSLSHIRGIFLESLYSINSNFTNMSCKALFLYVMSMCDQNILNLSASYIENILCIRTLIKLSCHTISGEAVHSEVFFFFYDNIQLILSFSLNFYFTFFVCYCFVTEIFVSKIDSIKLS